MALTAGTVSIDPSTGAETTSGASGAVYAAMKALTPSSSDGVEVGLRVASRQALADMANSIASTLITYIIANAEVVIGTGDSGLQRTPSPNDPSTETLGPTSEKTLTIR